MNASIALYKSTKTNNPPRMHAPRRHQEAGAELEAVQSGDAKNEAQGMTG
jgi:hypothetical protein